MSCAPLARQNIEYVMHAKRRQAGKGTPARGIASASIVDRPTDVMQELSDNVCKCSAGGGKYFKWCRFKLSVQHSQDPTSACSEHLCTYFFQIHGLFSSTPLLSESALKQLLMSLCELSANTIRVIHAAKPGVWHCRMHFLSIR